MGADRKRPHGDDDDDRAGRLVTEQADVDPGRRVRRQPLVLHLHDRSKAEELWNVFAEAWFPDGVEDPNLALLRVDVEHAHYWEDKKPKALQFAEIVLGAIKDTPPKSGDEKELDLRR